MNILEIIKRWLRKQQGREVSSHRETLSKELIEHLMRSVGNTLDNELSCDQVFALLDEYTEKINHGEEAERLMPLVKHHIDMCPDCREEFEALMMVLQEFTK